jgi:asparagine synthase (glutamine-hydrolysing)
MCGIAGFVDRAEADVAGQLRRMLGLIVHRGPDGEGTHVEPGLGLGMRRLSIIDLECGHQPIWNETKDVAVVFNGEIYNYVELRRELEAKGHRFSTHSDTEVLVHLYEDLGAEMTSRLRGMFAFCILDRTRRSLLLARDHFGQKPLYYTASGGRFAFASEMKCLLALPWVDRALDDDAFLDWAAWLSLPPPRTHLRAVRKLAAGCLLKIDLNDPERAAPQRYWRYELNATPDLNESAAAVEALDAALTESVAVHLRADVPLGVLLSSGLDSRTVTAYAQAQIRGTMQTFTVGFGDEDSELAGAAETAREIGSKHHQFQLTATDFADSMGRVAWHLDEPVGDPACFAVLRVCEMAREHVKVLLSGEGSDELFGGYEARYAGMLATMERTAGLRRWRALLPRARAHASPSRWQRLFARAHSTPAGEIATLRMEGLPGDVRHPHGLTPAQLARLFPRIQTLGEDVFRPQRDRLSELLTFDLDWQLAESLLQKADKMSMAASIELRTPLLDLEVARVAARIPSTLKLPPGGPGKLILRQTLARKLKEDPARPKKGFPVPLKTWLAGPLRDQVEAELFATQSAVCRHLDRKLLRFAWDDFTAGRWDGGRTLFSLWLYEIWQRSLVERRPSPGGTKGA